MFIKKAIKHINAHKWMQLDLKIKKEEINKITMFDIKMEVSDGIKEKILQ